MNRKYFYTKERLEEVVRNSKAWSEVCRVLGVKPATGTQSHIKKRAVEWGIDFSHFLGAAWNRGRVFGSKRSIDDYLNGKIFITSDALRKRLIKDGIKKAECEECFNSEWRGEPIVLELDHINDDHNDNRLENLRIMCPNCHGLKTRRARKSRRKCAADAIG